LIHLEKSTCLQLTALIEIGVHATALDNPFQVVVRLPVPYQIDFFDAQFSVYFAAAIPLLVRPECTGPAKGGAKIEKLPKVPFTFKMSVKHGNL
jgi:hypothetical protein